MLQTVLICMLVVSSIFLVGLAWGEIKPISTRRALFDDHCPGQPCAVVTQCRNSSTNQCGTGSAFCNALSSWNNTGCQLLVTSSSSSTGAADGAASTGAAVGGAFGAIAAVGVGVFVVRKKNFLRWREPIRETPWTPEELAALQRAYDFTKDFDSVCKAVPTKTPAEIAIRLKKVLKPPTFLQRASMMFFSSSQGMGSLNMAPTPLPRNMVPDFKTSNLSPFSSRVGAAMSSIPAPSMPRLNGTSFAFMRSGPSIPSMARGYGSSFAFFRSGPAQMREPQQMMMPQQSPMMMVPQQPSMMAMPQPPMRTMPLQSPMMTMPLPPQPPVRMMPPQPMMMAPPQPPARAMPPLPMSMSRPMTGPQASFGYGSPGPSAFSQYPGSSAPRQAMGPPLSQDYTSGMMQASNPMFARPY